jgi:arylsulfatase A-like enzyme
MSNVRDLCRAAVAPLVALALSTCASRAPAIENVILISIDTLRPDRLGAYGGERGLTPALDGLAARGAVFEQAIAQAPWTIPSHASFLTSEYPSALGVGPYRDPGKLSPAALTLAEAFREHGFATAAITGGYVSRVLGFEQGFDAFHETLDEPVFASTRAYAERWLDQRDPKRPFFLFLHTFEVHQYRPPADLRERLVTPYDGPLRQVERVSAFVQDGETRAHAAGFSQADWRYLADLYDACVASVDAEIGRLLATLAERGLLEQTLVVVTSDHGEEFGEHGGSGHGYTLYDENLRVPLVLGHRSLAARRVPEQVRLLDLAPTLVELAGLSAPPSWRGQSLVPLLEGAALAPLPAFSEHAHRPLLALREAGAKLIVDPSGARTLFDLARDPAERADVAGRDPEREQRLCRSLRALVESNAAHHAEGPPEPADAADLDPTLRKLGYLGTRSAPPEPADAWLERLDCATR